MGCGVMKCMHCDSNVHKNEDCRISLAATYVEEVEMFIGTSQSHGTTGKDVIPNLTRTLPLSLSQGSKDPEFSSSSRLLTDCSSSVFLHYESL